MVYPHGVGSHSASSYWLALDGGGEKFQATVGVDDQAGGPGTVVFKLTGDDRDYEEVFTRRREGAKKEQAYEE